MRMHVYCQYAWWECVRMCECARMLKCVRMHACMRACGFVCVCAYHASMTCAVELGEVKALQAKLRYLNHNVQEGKKITLKRG